MAIVLITCVGSGVGQSIVDSLNLSNGHTLIGCDGNRNIYAHHFCNKFYFSPSLYSGEYIDRILDICAVEKVDMIIPGHDHELSILSNNIHRFEEKGIRVLVSLPDIIHISRNKYEWYKFFKEYDCPVVPTFKVSEFKQNPDQNIFPAIVKPVSGSASQGISIVHDMESLNEVADDDIIQPYLFPLKEDENYQTILNAVRKNKFVQMSEISMQLIFTKDSDFAGIFISRNILKNGIPVFIDPIQPENFEYLDDIMKFVPVCIKFGVKGPVNIQGRITEKGLICFEMNMRFTGITGNRAQLGFNEVEFLVNNFLDKPAKLYGYAKNKLGVRQVACTTIPRERNQSKFPAYSILGAGGFIGSHFVHKLMESGEFNEINLICRDSSYDKYKSEFEHDHINIIKATDTSVQTKYCQSDLLVNFIGALAYEPDHKQYEAILFLIQQMQKIMIAGIPLCINISSQSVYDQKANIAKTEMHTPLINNIYAFQKYIGELFFKSIGEMSPLMKSISLRITRVIGCPNSGKRPFGLFSRIIESLQDNKVMEISNPENTTNLIDVRDVTGAILHIISQSDYTALPDVINVGGTNLSMKEYCAKVIETLKFNDNIQFTDNDIITTSSMVDAKLLTSLGWKPSYSIEDTIRHIYSGIQNAR
jgi:nucleoside-diphosphate-sugar epimerase